MKVKLSLGHKDIILSLSKPNMESNFFFTKAAQLCYLRMSHKKGKLQLNFPFLGIFDIFYQMVAVTRYLGLAICYLLYESLIGLVSVWP